MERMEANESLAEMTAKGVIETVESAFPVKEVADQQEVRTREVMRATMTGMEKARDRIGNFCVSIGKPDDEYSYAIILAAPVQEPYSPEYLAQVKDKAYDNGGTDATSSLTYIMVNSGGFYQYDFHEAFIRLYTPKRSPRQQGAAFTAIINDTVKKSAEIDSTQVSVGGTGLEIKPGTKDKDNERFVFKPADRVTVEKALKASIDLAKKMHQPQIDRANVTIQTAEAFQADLGMPVTASTPVESQKSHNSSPGILGRLFGRSKTP